MESSKRPKTNIEVIARAIKRRSVISFTYSDVGQLIVEPIAIGILTETGKHALRCYKCYPPQISDSADNWYLCQLDSISNLKTTPMRSKDFRKGSKTLTGDMSEIIECSPDYEKQELLNKRKK
jgi:hypothetical protein